ncbi:MAG: sugar transport permease [Ferroplasma sp. Type II]|uniref:MFS transporter n=1 Tax=Ferroplasma sp. Type II TaxID=261388 RepID=UPI0003896011|nr:MFS transporter [Ferroplasma sp. Type II]EQB74553.1 MAG: sugar transport permease [Ferroplasma sp. Type II]
MDSIFKLGFQKKETVRQAAGESLKRFIVIAIVAGLPAFLEGFDGEIYSFGSTYIVPALTGPTYLSIGLILTGYAIGIAIFSLVGGYLFDRYSVKNTVILSVLVFSAFTVMTGFVNTTPELFIARLGVGVGVGIFQPAGVALLGDIFYETRGKAVSVWATFFSVGLFASPYLIEPFLPAFRLPFEISGALAIIILMLVIMIIPVTYKTIPNNPLNLLQL